MTQPIELSELLVLRLKCRRSRFEANWNAAFWALGKVFQEEILFWSKETGISCEQIVREEWKKSLANTAALGKIN